MYIFKRQRKRDIIVCSICENGSGKDGAGITENPQNKGNYKCFKCGECGDVLHFIGKEFGLRDFKDILNRGIELYSIVIEGANYKGHTTASKASKSKQE
ncbi:MAG: hypothetical protein LBS61_02745, partial [Endomicrobium sp.]|nr:hypothetical protein [Endomicrobium sp.]